MEKLFFHVSFTASFSYIGKFLCLVCSIKHYRIPIDSSEKGIQEIGKLESIEGKLHVIWFASNYNKFCNLETLSGSSKAFNRDKRLKCYWLCSSWHHLLNIFTNSITDADQRLRNLKTSRVTHEWNIIGITVITKQRFLFISAIGTTFEDLQRRKWMTTLKKVWAHWSLFISHERLFDYSIYFASRRPLDNRFLFVKQIRLWGKKLRIFSALP